MQRGSFFFGEQLTKDRVVVSEHKIEKSVSDVFKGKYDVFVDLQNADNRWKLLKLVVHREEAYQQLKKLSDQIDMTPSAENLEAFYSRCTELSELVHHPVLQQTNSNNSQSIFLRAKQLEAGNFIIRGSSSGDMLTFDYLVSINKIKCLRFGIGKYGQWERVGGDFVPSDVRNSVKPFTKLNPAEQQKKYNELLTIFLKSMRGQGLVVKSQVTPSTLIEQAKDAQAIKDAQDLCSLTFEHFSGTATLLQDIQQTLVIESQSSAALGRRQSGGW